MRAPSRGSFKACPLGLKGEALVVSGWRAVAFFHPAAWVTTTMAFPHRPDAPELPDFSMLKRLARDQLIYLLEQVGARHVWDPYHISR